MLKVGFVTLGCDKNTVDSERYLGALAAYGAESTADLDDADVIVVNTCGFIDAAKQESVDALVDAGRRKTSGVCRAVVAVGCMVQRHKGELEDALPEVDLFLGAAEADRLVPELTERGLLGEPLTEHPGERLYAGDVPHVRYLKVSEGCDHGCAFCAIPLMRGKHRSFALGDVVREAQLLELQGAREINLVAQDLAHYGRDRRDVGLADLLDALVSETSVPWLRLLYVYSAGLTPAVLERMARHDRIVKYLDMPIQHGSDAVLARMRRPERGASIRRTVARVREAIPDVALRTTCIVGFPGETDEDFERLMALLEEVQFERVGAFTYSAQEGTRAAELVDDVPEPVKRERLERLTELQRTVTAERYERRLGRVATALVDRVTEHGIEARLACQADDIDGITWVNEGAVGQLIEVSVDAVVDDYDFRATTLRVVQAALTASSPRRSLPLAPRIGTAIGTSIGSFGR
jgi:ribosomal protein S12 methylthiotransferase